jgi:hypothetical protein
MKNALFLLLVLLLSACNGNTAADSPENVLPKEKMAEVMVDIQLMEASLNLSTYNPQKVGKQGSIVSLNLDVLKKHNISKQQYDQSFEYYCKNPLELGEVYQLVLNRLSQLQAEVTSAKQ